MHMGNLLSVEKLSSGVMAVTAPRIGIRHLTVVPANYGPDPENDADEEDDGSPPA